MSEEAFFTESLVFHTITIDEGHRLKNENSMLCKSLGRLSAPFRLLLTGTPLQNNLHELWALLNYIIPGILSATVFDDACNLEQGEVDSNVVEKSRTLLESMMIRRIKSEVEKTLLPKVHFTLKVPLSALQRYMAFLLPLNTLSCTKPTSLQPSSVRRWYHRILSKDQKALGLLSQSQLVAIMMQLQKVCNHPKVHVFVRVHSSFQ